jgi:hypothetical protein
MHAVLLQVSWLDDVSSIDSQGRQLHLKAQLQDGSTAAAGQAVQLSGQHLEPLIAAAAGSAAAGDAGGLPQVLLRVLAQKRLTGLLQCMWENEEGGMMAQVGCCNANCCT